MKTITFALMSTVVSMVALIGCSSDMTMVPIGSEKELTGATCSFHSGPPDLPLFTLHDEHVAYSEEISAGRNVVHIGENTQVDLVVLIGEPDAPIDSCSVVYIHHDLVLGEQVPGQEKYIVDGIWQCLNGKRHVPFQSLPKEQRYLRVPTIGETFTVDFRLANLDNFLIEEVGVELTGGVIKNEQEQVIGGFLGERVVSIVGDPMVCHFRLLFPEEI